MPSKEQVKAALDKVQRRVDYEFFFDNLNSPDWLDPLDENNQFSKPEEPIRDGDTIRFPFWPPSRYLIKVAPKRSEKVMGIILRVPDTENPRVHEDFVEAALKMRPDIAVNLHKSIVKWLRSPHLYLLLLPDKVATYIVHIRSGGFSKESLLVADSLLSIKKYESKVPETDTFIKRADPIVRSDWEYNEILKEISSSFDGQDRFELIDLLCHKLYQAILIEERDSDSEFRDLSYIWRGSIEESDQNHEYSIKDTIINWIRNLSEHLLRETPQLVVPLIDKLLARPFPIFTRLALHIGRLSGRSDLIRRLMLDQKLFDCFDVWHEYGNLIEVGFPQLDEADQKSFLEMIANDVAAPNKGKVGAEVDERANEHSRYFYYYMIKNHLTGEAKEIFNTLHAKFGDLENPTFHSYSSSWVGPTSPMSVEELKVISLDELRNFLVNWKPTKETFGPSIEGLGRELERVVSEKYSDFVDNLTSFKLTEKTYVRAVIQGLSKAVADKKNIMWEPVLDYLLWACGQSDESDDDTFHPEDDKDPTWGWARQAACRLLEKGLISGEHEVPFSFRGKVWSILAFCLSDPDPRVEKEDKYTSNNNFYQTAINSVRGEALDTVMHYAYWVKRGLGLAKSELPVAQANELFSVLDRHLNLEVEKSKAVRAMFGRWIPWLLPLNKEWFRSRIDSILPKEEALKEYWAAAWNANILFNQPYTNVFTELKDHYLLALDGIGSCDDDSWDKVEQRLLEHLIALYLYGGIELSSEIFKKLYVKIDLKLKKHATDLVGRVLSNKKKEVEKEVVERAVQFWNFRVEELKKENDFRNRIELSEFGWWMRSTQVPDEWILDQAIVALNLCHHITPDHMAMDRVVSLAEEYPVKATEVFRLIVEHRVSDYGFYGWLDKALLLLPVVMKSEAREVAIKIIHKLGAYGFNQFKGLLPEKPHLNRE